MAGHGAWQQQLLEGWLVEASHSKTNLNIGRWVRIVYQTEIFYFSKRTPLNWAYSWVNSLKNFTGFDRSCRLRHIFFSWNFPKKGWFASQRNGDFHGGSPIAGWFFHGLGNPQNLIEIFLVNDLFNYLPCQYLYTWIDEITMSQNDTTVMMFFLDYPKTVIQIYGFNQSVAWFLVWSIPIVYCLCRKMATVWLKIYRCSRASLVNSLRLLEDDTHIQ